MAATVRRRRLRPGAITGAVETWLPQQLEGADAVRRAVALRLALELDTRSTPAHAIPRAANALLAAVAGIEAEEAPLGVRDSVLEARRLLAEVFPP